LSDEVKNQVEVQLFSDHHFSPHCMTIILIVLLNTEYRLANYEWRSEEPSKSL